MRLYGTKNVSLSPACCALCSPSPDWGACPSECANAPRAKVRPAHYPPHMTSRLLALIAVPALAFGLAACGDDAPVTRAEGEPCLQAYKAFNAAGVNSIHGGSSRIETTPAYWSRVKRVLDQCTYQSYEFAKDQTEGEISRKVNYDVLLETWCDAEDPYRETSMCEGVPQ